MLKVESVGRVVLAEYANTVRVMSIGHIWCCIRVRCGVTKNHVVNNLCWYDGQSAQVLAGYNVESTHCVGRVTSAAKVISISSQKCWQSELCWKNSLCCQYEVGTKDA